MKTLYLRIYLTVVAVLLLFALVAGWLLQRNIEEERSRFQLASHQRLVAWGELLQNVLPAPDAPAEEQADALRDWSGRLRLPMALDDPDGRRIGAAPGFVDERGGGRPRNDEAAGGGRPPPNERGDERARPPERPTPQRVRLSDGRTLWILRPGAGRAPPRPEPPAFVRGVGLVVTLVVLFIAVAGGAFPVVRRLTRRLEALKQGVEAFGAGALDHRVDASGRDEVAALAAAFNDTAGRVQSLLHANRSLLANASHEIRSPLARLKMAVEMLDRASPERRPALKTEIERNIAELDALVEEVLLASRLDARMQQPSAADERVREPVDVIAMAAEESARCDALLELPDAGANPAAAVPDTVRGDERLLRRAVRNLLENARRYGGTGPRALQLERRGGAIEIRVLDRGPGVPPDQRERIFEPFYRMPGHAEQAGGIGLGLSLVRQIAQHHGGTVQCLPRDGGGSCFVLSLPLV